MSIRTITLTIELDDVQQGQNGYDVALDIIEAAEVKLRSLFLARADIRVRETIWRAGTREMEFSREAKP